MRLVDVIVAGLATWRVSNMLVNEYGPFGIFLSVRKAAGIEHTEAGTPITWPSNNAFACLWCLSIWIAPLMIRFPRVARVFAVAAVAIIVSEKGVS